MPQGSLLLRAHVRGSAIGWQLTHAPKKRKSQLQQVLSGQHCGRSWSIALKIHYPQSTVILPKVTSAALARQSARIKNERLGAKTIAYCWRLAQALAQRPSILRRNAARTQYPARRDQASRL